MTNEPLWHKLAAPPPGGASVTDQLPRQTPTLLCPICVSPPLTTSESALGLEILLCLQCGTTVTVPAHVLAAKGADPEAFRPSRLTRFTITKVVKLNPDDPFSRKFEVTLSCGCCFREERPNAHPPLVGEPVTCFARHSTPSRTQ